MPWDWRPNQGHNVLIRLEEATMSAFKSILVPMADDTSEVALDTALTLAGRFVSHVSALHVRIDPTNAVPLVGEGMSGAMVDEMIAMAEGQAAQRAAQAKALFDKVCARHGAPLATCPPAAGLSAEWIEVVGREDDVVAWRGRLADLLVFAHPGGNAELPAMMTMNNALMGAARPLLLCPKLPVSAANLGQSVAIAWNGSAEAARAVAAALPLLRDAGTVTILSVTEQVEKPVDAPAGELAAYLAWNGVSANTSLVQAKASHAGEELIRQIRAANADLLVMGAYTHSRLRQLILGGVTRHLIEHAPVHVLMSH
jgi:nucleotide-binding universal stress UspA family protein